VLLVGTRPVMFVIVCRQTHLNHVNSYCLKGREI